MAWKLIVGWNPLIPYFPKYTFLPPRPQFSINILHTLALGSTFVPKEIEDKTYEAIFFKGDGGNKVYCE